MCMARLKSIIQAGPTYMYKGPKQTRLFVVSITRLRHKECYRRLQAPPGQGIDCADRVPLKIGP